MKRKNHIQKPVAAAQNLIALHDLYATYYICHEEIAMLSPKNNGTLVLLHNHSVIHDHRKIDYFSHLLSENQTFIEVEERKIINLACIEKIEKNTPARIFLKNQPHFIEISNSYYHKLIRMLTSHHKQMSLSASAS